MNYNEQEAAKQEAWAVLRDPGATVYKKAWYALHKLCTPHYWRARQALEKEKAPFLRKVHGNRYSRYYELDIDVYTGHWLFANASLLFPAEVLDAIATYFSYTPQEHKLMQKGMTMYGEGMKRDTRKKTL